MLADFLTMHEASGKPYDAIGYAFAGDCRFNMGRSLLVMGALMGSDVRLVGPRNGQAHESRLPRTRLKLSSGSTSFTPTRGCLWVSPRTSEDGL
jgi:ornithine carbamoyltransferase